jgi:hypothetical protein
MSPDPERRNDAWMPVYYPASAVSAVRLTPGEAVHISPHDVCLGNRTIECKTDIDAVVEKVITNDPSWPAIGLAALRWRAARDPGVCGLTMFPQNWPVRRLWP